MPKRPMPQSALPLKKRRHYRERPYPPVLMEKKGMDTTLSLSPVLSTTSTNGSSQILNLIQPGTNSWNRIGRKTHLKSLRIQGEVRMNSVPDATTGVIPDNTLRMVVVWDKQPSGATQPTFGDIFATTVQDGTEATTSIFNPPRFDNMDRFRVIRDKTFDFDLATAGNVGGTTGGVTVRKHVDEYIKLAELESVYSGQSSPMTLADISTGALYVYWRAVLNGASTSTCDVVCNGRVRFTD